MMSPFTPYTLHFSLSQFLLQQQLKPKNIAHQLNKTSITSTSIRQQLNIQSSGLKLVKLSYLVGSVDRKNIFPNDLIVANILITAAPSLNPCYNSSTIFPELVRPLSQLLDDFLCCPCYLSMAYFNTQFPSIYNGSDSFPGFLNIFITC